MFLHEAGVNALRSRVGLPPLESADGLVTAASSHFEQYPVGSMAHTLALAVLAFCTGTLKTVSHDIATVLAANIYEEEDVIPDALSMNLMSSVTPKDAVILLRDAETALLLASRSLRGPRESADLATMTAAAKKGKGKASKQQSAIGVTVGPEPVNVSGVAGFAPDSPFAASPLTVEPFAGDPSDVIKSIDGIANHLRLKRAYLIAQLQLVCRCPSHCRPSSRMDSCCVWQFPEFTGFSWVSRCC
jgi:Mak10 subunit, NatC N(alpha)-terminal acetyltransferase